MQCGGVAADEGIPRARFVDVTGEPQNVVPRRRPRERRRPTPEGGRDGTEGRESEERPGDGERVAAHRDGQELGEGERGCEDRPEQGSDEPGGDGDEEAPAGTAAERPAERAANPGD